MWKQYIIVFCFFFVIMAGMLLSLHLAGYKKRRSCTCGHGKYCNDTDHPACRDGR